ncbi:hypothetical protein ACFQ0D_03425, partial [Micromonospora zhanjiangensis]
MTPSSPPAVGRVTPRPTVRPPTHAAGTGSPIRRTAGPVVRNVGGVSEVRVPRRLLLAGAGSAVAAALTGCG